jgi:protoporphyrinogen oxidase
LEKRRIVIIGAGPAGLTAALEFLRRGETDVTVLEESEEFGGISRTIVHNGNRMDIGGHRFFSKSKRIMDWWVDLMPVQGAPSMDDRLLERVVPLSPGGPDPESSDRVMLWRRRVSRIYYLRKFFDYPVSLKPETIANLGLVRTFRAGVSYVWSSLFKRRERTLEDFMINRFGRALYRMFFENYTQKVWGKHPSDISPAWGAQRIKGVSLFGVVWDFLSKRLPGSGRGRKVETSLIEEFLYPKLGPGQLWETAASEVAARGGRILTGCRVTGLTASGGRITTAICEREGDRREIEGDIFLSSMPIRDLVGGISGDPVPGDVAEVASGLPYRDFITVGILASRMRLRNMTSLKTVGDIIPDCWIYIQEPEVKVGRVQVFNNWSPYMVKDPKGTVWIGLEYFCDEGDEMWRMGEAEFVALASEEIERIGIVDRKDILDGFRVRVKKAYPAYFGSHDSFDLIRDYLDSFENLYCIGRNGQHRYNNMDHSMLTAIAAVESALSGSRDKESVWAVNTEDEYHEARRA